jgi:hypothetical protein
MRLHLRKRKYELALIFLSIGQDINLLNLDLRDNILN